MVFNNTPLLKEYFSGKSYQGIGDRLSISRERVRQKIGRELPCFYANNPNLVGGFTATIKANGMLFFNRSNAFLRQLSKILRIRHKFLTVSGYNKKHNGVAAVFASSRDKARLKEAVKLAKSLYLPIKVSGLQGTFKQAGLNVVYLAYILKRYGAVIKEVNGVPTVVRFTEFSATQNLKLFLNGHADIPRHEAVEEASVFFDMPKAVISGITAKLKWKALKRFRNGKRNVLITFPIDELEHKRLKEVSRDKGISVSSLTWYALKEASKHGFRGKYKNERGSVKKRWKTVVVMLMPNELKKLNKVVKAKHIHRSTLIRHCIRQYLK